jgi:cytochrome c peroxidase
MHNGVYKTPEEVIDFYDKGGGQGWGGAYPIKHCPQINYILPKQRRNG